MKVGKWGIVSFICFLILAIGNYIYNNNLCRKEYFRTYNTGFSSKIKVISSGRTGDVVQLDNTKKSYMFKAISADDISLNKFASENDSIIKDPYSYEILIEKKTGEVKVFYIKKNWN